MNLGLTGSFTTRAKLALLCGLATTIVDVAPSLAVQTMRSQRNRYEWVRWAKLERSTAVDRWMSAARGSVPEHEQKSPSVVDVMRGIVAAFGDHDIRFRGGPMMRYGQDPQGSDHVQPPEMLLTSRRGKCTDTALLVAGTLIEMKQEVVLVLTPRHVVAGAVSRLSEVDGVRGVPLPMPYPGMSGPAYLYALDATFFGGDFQMTTALQEGQGFARRALDQTDVRVILPTTGEILWNGGSANAIRFGAPLPRPSDL